MAKELTENNLADSFENKYGEKPTAIIKAPGRVNLIGEHTDYNGYPVFPISIPCTIDVAISSRKDKSVHIANTDAQFADTSFEISGDIPHSPIGDWSNYVKAGANELGSRLDTDLCGMNALYHGRVPNSAGLSSSSALVVASALAVLTSNGIDMDSLELAEAMAYGEHYVGTQGGGMDQAICLLGKQGHAVKLDFFPLRNAYAPLLDGYSIIVANSLVRAAKTENALIHYNRRPAECRLATAMINTLYNIDSPLARLGDLAKTTIIESYDSIADFVAETFEQKSYSLDEVSKIIGESPDEVTSKYLMTRSGETMPVPSDGFLIPQRVLHVLTEAARVEKSYDALIQNDPAAFGKYMNESHVSCDKSYGISTPELNVLTEIMRESGAEGARLTGAGFGGCAVALVKDSKIEQVMESVQKNYYVSYMEKHKPELLKDMEGIDNLIFNVKPANGATVKKLI